MIEEREHSQPSLPDLTKLPSNRSKLSNASLDWNDSTGTTEDSHSAFDGSKPLPKVKRLNKYKIIFVFSKQQQNNKCAWKQKRRRRDCDTNFYLHTKIKAQESANKQRNSWHTHGHFARKVFHSGSKLPERKQKKFKPAMPSVVAEHGSLETGMTCQWRCLLSASAFQPLTWLSQNRFFSLSLFY